MMIPGLSTAAANLFLSSGITGALCQGVKTPMHCVRFRLSFPLFGDGVSFSDGNHCR